MNEPAQQSVIDVWLLARATLSPHALDHWLLPQERQHAEQIVSHMRREEWRAGRALLRACLADHTGLAPHALPLSRNENDKPQLDMPVAPAFNLSHGPRWIACAVAPVAQLGIDLDSEQRSNRVQDIARQYFHPDEQCWLAQADDAPQYRARFFAHWTLKEAHIKALGERLNGARLYQYAFDTGAATPRALFVTGTGHWQWRHWCFDETEHLALACCTADAQVALLCRFWQWDGNAAVPWPELSSDMPLEHFA